MATVLGLALASQPADAQSVSAPNFSVGGAGGDFANKGAGFGVGQVDLPVGPLGVEADPFAGDVGGHGFYGVGGELFARDPSLGSIGGIGEFEWSRGANVDRYGAQGEYYLPQVDLALRGGYQDGHNVSHGGFAAAHAGFYITPDFEIGTASEIYPAAFAQSFDAEYLPHWQPLPNMSLFADARVGDRSQTMVLFGVRFYFGPEKSLQDRHHTDDPWQPIPQSFAVNKSHPSGPVVSPPSPPPPPPPPSPPPPTSPPSPPASPPHSPPPPPYA